MKTWGTVVLVHLLLAAYWIWPTPLDPAGHVPGALRTDLWDSLWSFWFVFERITGGRLPLEADGLLNYPTGGLLWVADPLNGLLMVPLQALFSLPVAWSLLVWFHQAAAGVVSFGLAYEIAGNKPAAWLSSVLYASAPVLLCHIHNGASEAVSGAWLPAACWALWRLAEAPGLKRGILASVLVGLCALSQWYAGVAIAIFALTLAVFRATRLYILVALALGTLLAMPNAAVASWASTTEGNLIGIKQEKELIAVRRTIGPADPLAYFYPGDYRSPDFRELSRYGEEYLHSPYLGLTAILLALYGLFAGRGDRVWWGALVVGLLLSLGPVLVQGGEPVILPGKRAVPLPYLLLEKLPGFSGLSLLWRLAQLPALALAILAGLAWPVRWGWGVVLPVVLFIGEVRYLSPVAGLPDHTNAVLPEPLMVLRDAPEGAVMNYPLVGGRSYLFEQTLHRKPLAASLNFPNNKAAMKVWKAALDYKSQPDFAATLAGVARKAEIRYLVVHVDAMARPDMHDMAVRTIKEHFTPIAQAPAIRIYQFW